MLVESGLQLSALSLKEQQLLLMVGKLLLLQGQDVQEHTDELADCWRCRRPVVRCNPIGWCQIVHAASMPGDAMAVKSHGCGGLGETS